jgi:hypothetical protein
MTTRPTAEIRGTRFCDDKNLVIWEPVTPKAFLDLQKEKPQFKLIDSYSKRRTHLSASWIQAGTVAASVRVRGDVCSAILRFRSRHTISMGMSLPLVAFLIAIVAVSRDYRQNAKVGDTVRQISRGVSG